MERSRRTVKTSGWSQEGSLAGIFRASDFPAPQPGQNGNLVRNAYRGPGYVDVSLSVSKKFQMTARVTAEFRADAFNAFNRVNLSDPVGEKNEQLKFWKGDVAAEYAGDPARRSAAILSR